MEICREEGSGMVVLCFLLDSNHPATFFNTPLPTPPIRPMPQHCPLKDILPDLLLHNFLMDPLLKTDPRSLPFDITKKTTSTLEEEEGRKEWDAEEKLEEEKEEEVTITLDVATTLGIEVVRRRKVKWTEEGKKSVVLLKDEAAVRRMVHLRNDCEVRRRRMTRRNVHLLQSQAGPGSRRKKTRNDER